MDYIQEVGNFDRRVKARQMLKCIEDLKLGPNGSESRYTSFLRWIFGLGCIVLIILALLPPAYLAAVEPHFTHFSWWDKVLHAAAFAGLCLIGSWAYLNRSYPLMLGLLVLGGGNRDSTICDRLASHGFRRFCGQCSRDNDRPDRLSFIAKKGLTLSLRQIVCYRYAVPKRQTRLASRKFESRLPLFEMTFPRPVCNESLGVN